MVDDGDVEPLNVLTEEEFKARVAKGGVVLLQIGSKPCVRCPAFKDAILKLTRTRQFIWLYCDAHDDETDIPETYGITKLPAFVMCSEALGSPLVVANATIEDLNEAVQKHCLPVFLVDADF